MKRLWPLWLIAALLANPAAAELSGVGSGGFTTSHAATIPASPERAWQALTTEIGQWWESAHTWGGDAAALFVDARPGGCFCERLADGGWVEHLRVIYLAPGHELRLRGALGPLMQMGLEGVMTWTVEPLEDGGSRLQWTYTVSGWSPKGLEALAPAVDGVVGAQFANLVARLAEG